MTSEQGQEAERSDHEATTLSEASKDRDLEAGDEVPVGPKETIAKTATEAGAGDGVVDTVKRVGREVDRTFGGEYEAREEEAAEPPEDHSTRG